MRLPVIYRVNQAEYAIRILVAASEEYVNTYSTRRVNPKRENRVLEMERVITRGRAPRMGRGSGPSLYSIKYSRHAYALPWRE